MHDQDLLASVRSLADGDFNVRLDEASGEVATTINELASRLRALTVEVNKLRTDIVEEGRFGGQIEVPGAQGSWQDLVTDINRAAYVLTVQVRGVARVVTSHANGDLSMRIHTGAVGEVKELEDTMNAMGMQLSTMTSEISRIANEVRTGVFGGQIEVPGLAGAWRDVVRDVNEMGSTLTCQIRDISASAHAAKSGSPERQITVGAEGETALMIEMLNDLIKGGASNATAPQMR